MFRALKVFFAFICLVLSFQAVVTASSDVAHANEVSVTVPVVKLPPTVTSPAASLNGPVVIANQPSAVSANLRKKEENEVDLEGLIVISNRYGNNMLAYSISTRFLYRCDTIRCPRALSGAVDLQL